jgi:hypothetical protein
MLDLAPWRRDAGPRVGNSNLDAEESNLPADLGIFLTVVLDALLAPHAGGKGTTLLTYMTHQERELLDVGDSKRRCFAGVTATPSIIAV